jgi:hypothetical protein
MNVADLPGLMWQRAEDAPVPLLVESRVDAIRRKVIVGRQRTAASAVIAIALVLFGVVGLPRLDEKPTTTTGSSAKPVFPKLKGDYELLTTGHASLRSLPLTVTFTPTSLPVDFSTVCPKQDATTVISIELVVNGQDEGSGTCNDAPDVLFGPNDESRDDLVVGVPATATFSVEKTLRSHDTPPDTGANQSTPIPTPAGSLFVAVYQAVPVGQTSRPSSLPSLDAIAPLPYADVYSVVDSDPANPLAPRSFTFTYPKCPPSPESCIAMAVTSQTPGYLTVSVNGVAAGEFTFRGYQGYVDEVDFGAVRKSLHPKTGQTMTITVTPAAVSGGWQFAVAQPPPA